MKLDALEHPKTLDFAARLKVSRPTALGHLELLWAFTGKNSPQGNLGKWPDGAIARACDWMGEPSVFITALIEAGLLDVDDTHRLLVHDWQTHAAGWVRAKLKKAGLDFIGSRASTRDASLDEPLDEILEPPREATRVPTRVPSIPGKRREEKGSEEQRRARANGSEISAEGEMAIALRDRGVQVTSQHPTLLAWVRDGFTTQQTLDATDIARLRKPHPEPIPAGYLDKVLRQPQREPSQRKTRFEQVMELNSG